jgi:hypothetical protein
MKIIFNLLVLFCGFNALHSQTAPPGIPYQAIARNANGTPYVNANLSVRFSLHEQTATGTVSYSESKSLQTNDLGLFSTTFGSGTPITGTFAGINWSQTTKFLQVEINLGSIWLDMGTQQLMSVPYAMYSGTASSISNGSQTSLSTSCYSCPSMFSNVSSTTMIVQNSSLYCATLNEGGYTDWRLPSLSEYEYLRDVINLSSPIIDCWTKDFTIVGNVTYQTLAGAIYLSTNRIVMIGGELKTVCVR